MGFLPRNNGRVVSFEAFALVPTFVGLLSMILLNTVLTRQIILESPVDTLHATQPLRIMVFICMIGALGSVAMSVLLGLLRYVPMGLNALASSLTISSICLLSR